MRYFYDTEFIENGHTIDLMSIGIVAEDGREYYAVSTEFDPSPAVPWVRDHVLRHLPSPGSRVWKSRSRIRDEVLGFLSEPGEAIDLWAWVAAYDHLALAQLFGDMSALPQDIPRYTNELKQLWVHAGRPKLPPAPKDNHDALVDARFNLEKFHIITAELPLSTDNVIQLTL